jgi:TRAP-type C4-dicarboxylate transport system permease small subunit
MLGLALYSITYRNAVVPFINYLQTSDSAPPGGADERASGAAAGDAKPVAPTPAAAPTPASAAAPAEPEPESDFDSDFGGGDPAEPTAASAAPAAPAAPAEPESDFDSDFGGGGADEPVTARPADDAESDFDSDFGGGGDDAKPVTAVVKPKPPAPPVIRQDSGFVKLLLWFNFDWVDIVMRHLILWVAFFGGALATQRRKHIAIDALAKWMPEKGKAPVSLLVSIVSMVTCFALAYAAANFTLLEAEHGRALFGSVPGWSGPVIIPVGFGLMSFHFAFRSLEAAAAMAGKHELPPDVLEVTLQ